MQCGSCHSGALSVLATCSEDEYIFRGPSWLQEGKGR